MKPLYIIWLIACAAIIVITMNFKNSSPDFHGIADTREIIINSENPVEVKRLHVVPGQAVKKDDLLVEFERPDLTKEINTIIHEIEELKTIKKVNFSEIRSQISSLEAEKAKKTSEINYQIELLKSELDVNKKLVAKLKSIEAGQSDKKQNKNPIQIRIESLEKELKLSIHPLQIQIDALKQELNASEDPAKVRLERLEKELNLLSAEKNNLYIFSPITGIIGSVNVKSGEKISPFTPVLTLHGKSPSYVKGYIHENVYNRVNVGAKVEIISFADSNKRIVGEVVGIGTRIVPYPERLKKMPEMQVWGREVQISMPDNHFLLGEKVLVSTEIGKKRSVSEFVASIFFSGKSHAKELANPENVKTTEPEDIRIPAYLKDIQNIEASGVIYLNDIKKYLVISDETKKYQPLVYLMDDEGNITEEIRIRGLDSIDDMEAITQDKQGVIYIACSQSFQKHGNLSDERKLLIRVKRNRTELTLDKKIYLYDLLANQAQNNPATWAAFINSARQSKEIDLEGIFINNGALFLGFKSPLLNGKKSVVLRIGDIDGLFNKERIDDITIWSEFELPHNESGAPTYISDLCIYENIVFILSCAKDKSGNLWAYDLEKKVLSFVMCFENLKSEGIAVNQDTNELLVTFDAGKNNPSKIMKIRGLL